MEGYRGAGARENKRLEIGEGRRREQKLKRQPFVVYCCLLSSSEKPYPAKFCLPVSCKLYYWKILQRSKRVISGQMSSNVFVDRPHYCRYRKEVHMQWRIQTFSWGRIGGFFVPFPFGFSSFWDSLLFFTQNKGGGGPGPSPRSATDIRPCFCNCQSNRCIMPVYKSIRECMYDVSTFPLRFKENLNFSKKSE